MEITKVLGAILMILSSIPWVLAESKLYEMSLEKFTIQGYLFVISYYMLAVVMTVIGLSLAFPANLGLLVGLWEIIAIVGIIFQTANSQGWKFELSIQILPSLAIVILGLVLLIYGSHQLQKTLGIL